MVAEKEVTKPRGGSAAPSLLTQPEGLPKVCPLLPPPPSPAHSSAGLMPSSLGPSQPHSSAGRLGRAGWVVRAPAPLPEAPALQPLPQPLPNLHGWGWAALSQETEGKAKGGVVGPAARPAAPWAEAGQAVLRGKTDTGTRGQRWLRLQGLLAPKVTPSRRVLQRDPVIPAPLRRGCKRGLVSCGVPPWFRVPGPATAELHRLPLQLPCAFCGASALGNWASEPGCLRAGRSRARAGPRGPSLLAYSRGQLPPGISWTWWGPRALKVDRGDASGRGGEDSGSRGRKGGPRPPGP